jgi:hypothetical protein
VIVTRFADSGKTSVAKGRESPATNLRVAEWRASVTSTGFTAANLTPPPASLRIQPCLVGCSCGEGEPTISL